MVDDDRHVQNVSNIKDDKRTQRHAEYTAHFTRIAAKEGAFRHLHPHGKALASAADAAGMGSS